MKKWWKETKASAKSTANKARNAASRPSAFSGQGRTLDDNTNTSSTSVQ